MGKKVYFCQNHLRLAPFINLWCWADLHFLLSLSAKFQKWMDDIFLSLPCPAGNTIVLVSKVVISPLHWQKLGRPVSCCASFHLTQTSLFQLAGMCFSGHNPHLRFLPSTTISYWTVGLPALKSWTFVWILFFFTGSIVERWNAGCFFVLLFLFTGWNRQRLCQVSSPSPSDKKNCKFVVILNKHAHRTGSNWGLHGEKKQGF